MLSRRPELFWLLIVSIVLLLAVWWIPGSSSVNTDSYSVAHGGKKVLYQTMRRLDSRVTRSVDQLVSADAFAADRILILGPSRYPSDEEWQSLYEAVVSGDSVVFAAQSGDPHVDCGPFRVNVASGSMFGDVDDLEIPTEDELTEQLDAEVEAALNSNDEDGSSSNPETSTDDEEDSDGEDEEIEVPNTFSELVGGRKATSKLVDVEVEWQSSGTIEMEEDVWDVLVEVDSVPQAVQRSFGRGTFTLIASDNIFSNGAMVEPDRALLAWRLLETASAKGATKFDETLNSSGVPKVFGILFDPLFRSITLQLILIAVLFGWLGSRRFGPARRSLHTRRRSVVEHAEAVGTLYFRAGAGPHAVKCLHEFLKQELRNRFGQTFQVDNAERVARQTRAGKQDVQELFDAIRAFSHAKRGSATAARLLKRLSGLLAGIRRQAQDDGNPYS
jgi:hypothetical protein